MDERKSKQRGRRRLAVRVVLQGLADLIAAARGGTHSCGEKTQLSFGYLRTKGQLTNDQQRTKPDVVQGCERTEGYVNAAPNRLP